MSSIASSMPISTISTPMDHAKKPEKFSGSDFIKWQQ